MHNNKPYLYMHVTPRGSGANHPIGEFRSFIVVSSWKYFPNFFIFNAIKMKNLFIILGFYSKQSAQSEKI